MYTETGCILLSRVSMLCTNMRLSVRFSNAAIVSKLVHISSHYFEALVWAAY